MKKLLFISLFFICPLLTEAQVTQKWVARYNGPSNNIDQPKAIAVDGSGNVFVTGDSKRTSTSVDFDYATIKYNSNGVQQWVQRYNGPGNSYEHIGAMTMDAAGNVYITGASWGTTSSFDCATIKYNSAGVQEWIHRFNGINNRNDMSSAIVIDAAGNVYIAGVSNYIYDDFLTVKYNSAGVLQWAQMWNGDFFGDDFGRSLAVDASGNVYTTGYSQGEGGGFNIVTVKYNTDGVEQWVREYAGSSGQDDWGVSILTDNSGNAIVSGHASELSTSWDYTTIKYNSTGTQQWLQRYSGPLNGGEFSAKTIQDVSGNIIVTGNSYGTGANQDYATVKYNSSGVQQWVSRYSGTSTGYDGAWSVASDLGGNVYVTGESNGTGSQRDYATIKYNPSGTQQWVQRYNGPGNSNDIARAIAVDNLGNVYVTGESTGSGGTGLDYATIKYSPKNKQISGISNVNPDEYKLMGNFPNPFNPSTMISYQLASEGFTSLKIYNVLGNEVATLVNTNQNPGTYSVQWDASGFSSGIYFYKLITNGFVETKKMNLIK